MSDAARLRAQKAYSTDPDYLERMAREVDGASPLRVRYYRPAARLRAYVSGYSFSEVVADAPPWLLQPGWAYFRFALSGHSVTRMAAGESDSRDVPARICGPTSHAYELTATAPARGIGVGLLPLGWTHFVGRPAHRFADRVEPFDAAFPGDSERLLRALRDASDDHAAKAILDDYLLGLHARRPKPQRHVIRAHELLMDPKVSTAEQLARGLGLSSRHVARLSLDIFGFTPKLLLRRQRFLRTLDLLRDKPRRPWATLLDATYHDQAHFVRDCHGFLGMSPSAFFTRQRAFFDLVTGLRRQAIGQSLQGLHPVVEPR